MSAGFCITVRNQHDEVVEYRTGNCVLHIDVPEGRYVITVSSEPIDAGVEAAALIGRLH
jgi:hypothetical protein